MVNYTIVVLSQTDYENEVTKLQQELKAVREKKEADVSFSFVFLFVFVFVFVCCVSFCICVCIQRRTY
jgi:Trk-type K+ transport system membrane component